MTIRTRLTLWYAAFMFVSLLAVGTLSYVNFVAGRHVTARDDHPGKADEERDFGEVFRILLWCGVPAAFLALAGGWWLMRKGLAPVAALIKAAERINEHNLGGRLPRTGNGDELDRLTEVFNEMSVRLEQSFARVREFTLHASHELKTPLTVIHGELETALCHESLGPVQRARLESELDEVRRLTRIVDGLTLLTKAGAGQVPLQRESVRVDELVQEAYADAQSLARAHEIQVSLECCERLATTGDRHRLRQLLLNLTDNAIKYNQPHGAVTLGLRRAGESAEIVIANTGPGIAPGALPRVFDPFFRGDSSHSHVIEGCGLGLSIARWIALAHGGIIQISSSPGQLTTALVRLPLSAT